MEVLQIYKIEDVLPYVFWHENPLCNTTVEKEYCGEKVYMNSARYQLFSLKGTKCVKCGLEGTYFALERWALAKNQRPHFNLYGKDAQGVQVLLTKDHIIPKSKGGVDAMNNYQVMCKLCNEAKRDKMEVV